MCFQIVPSNRDPQLGRRYLRAFVSKQKLLLNKHHLLCHCHSSWHILKLLCNKSSVCAAFRQRAGHKPELLNYHCLQVGSGFAIGAVLYWMPEWLSWGKISAAKELDTPVLFSSGKPPPFFLFFYSLKKAAIGRKRDSMSQAAS